MFLVAKKVGHGIYFQLVSEQRRNGKKVQTIKRHLGNYHAAKAKLKDARYLSKLNTLALRHGLISGDSLD
jgi:hypothetical protein